MAKAKPKARKAAGARAGAGRKTGAARGAKARAGRSKEAGAVQNAKTRAERKGGVRSRKTSAARSKAAGAVRGAKARVAKTGAARSDATRGGRVLHLDTFSGASGNMFLGALFDLGLSRRALNEALAGLGVDYRLEVRRVKRGPLAARYVTVRVPGARASGASGTAGAAHGRHYSAIRRLVARAGLPARAEARAQQIFLELAQAEARVHGIAVEKVHFHEVGAVDAIVDICGTAVALELLDVAHVSAAPPALGSGSVNSEHGRLPLPAPATLELLRGIPTVSSAAEFETVTPTGAAILRVCVDAFSTLPAMTPRAIGYGAGDDRPGPLPNVLRAVLGDADLLTRDRVVCLETNLDDFVPEHFDHVLEKLSAAGALDVSLQHIQMKKSRPGFLLRVLAAPDKGDALARCMLAETGSLGVRMSSAERLLLPRTLRRVNTRYGRIAVKVSTREDGGLDVSAEYRDCKRAAEQSGALLRDVIRAAEQAARVSS